MHKNFQKFYTIVVEISCNYGLIRYVVIVYSFYRTCCL
jgi:hypothetical protein